ncbi:ImmA/IrrE family metallo-endopeptidase [Corynebacterium bovis]|uniref:ImmA/IrrE family metallo-endopeptidase n=1 Tax=Corynebacterium bovis TaxID=36808 RepID=UPI003138A768
MTTTSRDLTQLAHNHDITLTHHTTGPKGWYHPTTRTISTRRGLSNAQYRSTLAHEIAHAIRGDNPTTHGWFNHHQETRADQWAAKFLITPSDFTAACAWARGRINAIAEELDVTQHLVAVYPRYIHPTHLNGTLTGLSTSNYTLR